MNIFSNGNFIGKQTLDFVPRDKEIKLPVGISEEVVATRKLVRRFEEDPGIVRSFRRISVEYAVELENLSQQKREIALLEPGVVSRNDKIKVTLSKEEPDSIPLEKESRIYKEPGVIEWQLTLAPGEKRTVNYENTVEFPADLQVSGVEGL